MKIGVAGVAAGVERVHDCHEAVVRIARRGETQRAEVLRLAVRTRMKPHRARRQHTLPAADDGRGRAGVAVERRKANRAVRRPAGDGHAVVTRRAEVNRMQREAGVQIGLPAIAPRTGGVHGGEEIAARVKVAMRHRRRLVRDDGRLIGDDHAVVGGGRDERNNLQARAPAVAIRAASEREINGVARAQRKCVGPARALCGGQRLAKDFHAIHHDVIIRVAGEVAVVERVSACLDAIV